MSKNQDRLITALEAIAEELRKRRIMQECEYVTGIGSIIISPGLRDQLNRSYEMGTPQESMLDSTSSSDSVTANA